MGQGAPRNLPAEATASGAEDELANGTAIVVDPAEEAQIARPFRLVHDVQAAIPWAADELAQLQERAKASGWGQVLRACLFAAAVRAWITRENDSGTVLSELIAESEAADDQVMLALGLAMRSDPGVASGDQVSAAARDQDLARAVAILESATGRVLERISAGYSATNLTSRPSRPEPDDLSPMT